MPKFGRRSKEVLNSCDPRLREICNEVIKIYDFSILEGYRPKEVQNRLYGEGRSKLVWPESKHNQSPSLAVDIAPYPIDWKDTGRFNLLAGMMFAVAHDKGIKLRWGGDWDGDFDMKDQDFNDLPHFQIVE